MLSAKKISAVICTYNRYDLLPKAIESLLDQSLPLTEYHIVVVDNSPENPDQKIFQEKYHGHKNIHYHIEKIAGLSNARNVGADIANSTYIAYLDDDAIAANVWIEKVIEGFEALPGENVGVVGGQILPIWSVPRPQWLPDSALGALSVVDWGGALRILGDSEWIAGANFSVKTQALKEAGGFNTELGRKGGGHILMSNEESQLKSLIEEKGYKTVYAPEATVDHLVDVRRVNRGWLRRRMAWQAMSEIMQDAPNAFDDIEKNWEGLEEFFAYLPPHLRTIRGFFQAFEDPNLTQKQISAFYSLAILVFGGFEIDSKG